MPDYCIGFDRYDHKSGGIRALHVLKDELNSRGLHAYMAYEKRYVPGDIAVYPEVIRDNPFGAKRVVRWLLNTASGLPNDGLRYAWTEGISDDPLLTVNIIEPELWTPYTGPREGVAYWVGKGHFDPSALPEGAIPITRDNYPTRESLAGLVRRLDYLISFDPFTAVITEAVVSGTPVVVLPHEMGQAVIGMESQWNLYGVAWGFDELDKARSNVHLAWQNYEDLKRVFRQRVKRFVRETQKM